MAEPAVDAPRGNTSKTETKKRNPVLRYDQVYDVQKSQYRLIKTEKSDVKKQNGRKAVLVVRRLIDEKGFHTSTEVDIKSGWVAEAMQEINADVEGISLRTTPPMVPLEIFYHNHGGLQEKLDEARNAEPRNQGQIADLEVAVKFADEEFASTRANLEPLLAAGEITWNLMWTIFPPNVLIYRFHPLLEQDQILKLRTMSKRRYPDKSRYWDFSCHVVTNDGVKFGLAYEPFFMATDEFSGTRKITDLRVLPLEYHPNAPEIRAEAVDRAQRFAELSDTRVMETSGQAIFEKRDRNWNPRLYTFAAHGRTIVDAAGFRSSNRDISLMADVIRGLGRDELTEEQLLICTGVVFGFCFSNKRWGGFAMSRLRDVRWNARAFQDLVMDAATKTLVHSMVKQHSSHDDTFDDIISGKGKGIICLFSGPPGSGKTLTAEAVAETTQRPLYSVSAGDLGVNPQTVDLKLSDALERSSQWNAVLLLDEADVFLQQRSPNDVKRNALVSIFLHQLEYYQGILILTTNRIAHCDTAFESRIHISIQYPDLDVAARKKIWITFFRNLEEVQPGAAGDFSDEDVTLLAQKNVNGRQIKNIFNSARIIAKEAGEELSMTHIDLVLRVTNLGLKAAQTNGVY